MSTDSMNRRVFIRTTAKAAAASTLPGTLGLGCEPGSGDIDPSSLPRWRGFNLLEKFIATSRNDPFQESDFEMMAEWGFDFVRLPMSYWCWSDPKDWRKLREDKLKEIDQAVEFGKQYGIHVDICFHRGPGYSVDRSAPEPFNLWTDAEAQEAFNYHWMHFAERYKGMPSRQVSFNLLNEPGSIDMERTRPVPEENYVRVAKSTVEAIRSVDPNRLIIADGLWWARDPVPGLADLKIAQSTRGYEPMQVSHYHASWVYGAMDWPVPAWPLRQIEAAELRWESETMREAYKAKLQKRGISLDMPWDKNRAKLQLVDPWVQLRDQGVGVHVGECGAHNQTPHDVVLAWMRDLLSLWKDTGFGYALWNLRGGFGILDSNRKDVAYEDFKGHKLDRKYLELLKEF